MLKEQKNKIKFKIQNKERANRVEKVSQMSQEIKTQPVLVQFLLDNKDRKPGDFYKHNWQVCSLKIYEDYKQWENIKRRCYWLSDMYHHTPTLLKWKQANPTVAISPMFHFSIIDPSTTACNMWHSWHFGLVQKHITEVKDTDVIEAARKTIHIMTRGQSTTEFDSDPENCAFKYLESEASDEESHGFDPTYDGPHTSENSTLDMDEMDQDGEDNECDDA